MGVANTTGTLLAQDRIDRFRPFGAFGKPAYQSHVQLRAMLLSKLGPKYANYFAKPVHDPDTGDLRWMSELAGEARSWESLSPEEQSLLAGHKEDVRSRLLQYASELRTQGGGQPGGASAYASLLEQAMKVPAQGNFLYFVGEQPMIAFWGFETQTGGSVDAAVTSAPVVETMAMPATPPLEEKKKRPWWWWLLWLLLLLLLLLAVLAGMRACSPTPPAVTPTSLPPIPAPPPPPPPPVIEPPAPVPEPAVSAPPPPPPPKPKPAAPPKPPEPPKPPDTRGLQPQAGLKILPNALKRGDLSFLEGLWQLGDQSLNAYQGSPNNVIGKDRLTMQFGKKGTGTNFGTERIRRGQSVPDCTGTATARTDGTKLYIERGLCSTPGNDSSVNGNKMECEVEASGETVCYVVNTDGHRWKAPLRRLK